MRVRRSAFCFLAGGAAAALAGSGYQLLRTQRPFDVTSEGTLSGDIGTGPDTGEAPRFTIVVARRLP